MAQLFGSSFWSRLNPAVCPEASGGATKSNTSANRSVARPTDSHFLIGALLSTLTLGMALILTRTAAYLNAPSLAAVKSVLPRRDRLKPSRDVDDDDAPRQPAGGDATDDLAGRGVAHRPAPGPAHRPGQ